MSSTAPVRVRPKSHKGSQPRYFLSLSSLPYPSFLPVPRRMAKSFRTFNELPLELVLDIAEHLPAHNDLSSLWRRNLCELGWPDNCDAHPLVFNHEQLFFQALLAKDRPDEQNNHLQTNALRWPSWNHNLTFDKLHHIMHPLDWKKVYGAPLESIAVHTDWEQVK
ncbi:hypothetical protein D6C79_04383 [Aureobasidium pullulans]|nr:hypothetical protein D6C79_04383 [Aureobasidium pullulans]